MATVHGAYEKDFSGEPDENPASDPDFIEFDEPAVARIASGIWGSPNNTTNANWMLDPSTYVPGNIIRVKIEVANTGAGAGSRDGIGIAICDASGNGYKLGVGNVLLRRHRIDAWVDFTGSGAEEAITGANSDEAELQYNKTTGAVTVYLNGVQVTSLNLTDTTYNANALAPVMFQRPGNDGAGGIRSFAADGVSVGSANALAHLKRFGPGTHLPRFGRQ